MKSYWAVITVIVALSIVYRAEFWVVLCVVLDYYTPWVLFESKAYDVYHNFLVSQLSEKQEIPLPELQASEATYDSVRLATKGYTFPVVIRNLLGNTTAVQNWGNKEWWIKNYGDEELLCGTLSEVEGDECTVRGFFNSVEKGRAFYVSGASAIFEKHPELHEMIDNEAVKALEPGKRIASQIFMGLPGSGSDIHCAIGVNIFRQITGRKKWYFIPPDQTKYLKPSWNTNGYSAHTMTKIGKGNETPSPWFTKLVRYTTTLNPGDVLLNPPWFWHGIDNLGEVGSTEIIIGSPVRYSQGVVREAAFKTNFLYTANALFVLYQKYGMAPFRPGFKVNLQKDIDGNRKKRNSEAAAKIVRVGETPTVEDGEVEDTESEGLHPFEQVVD